MTPPAAATSAPADHDAPSRHPLGAGPGRWPRPPSHPRRPPDTTRTATATDTAATATDAGRRPGRVWAYLGIVVGAVVSVAANVAHSFVPPPGWPGHATEPWQPEPGAVLGAMFWPVALLITTEIMTRTAWPPGRAWLLLRFVGLLPVAAVAGIVSYLHLHGLLQHYREAPLTCVIAPFSIDGLMVMASSALVAGAHHPDDAPTQSPKPTADTAATTPPTAPNQDRCDGCGTRPATTTWSRPSAGHPYRLCATCSPTTDTASTGSRSSSPAGPAVTFASGRSATARAVARLSAELPDRSTADIAARLGVSARTVRRHLANQRGTTPAR